MPPPTFGCALCGYGFDDDNQFGGSWQLDYRIGMDHHYVHV